MSNPLASPRELSSLANLPLGSFGLLLQTLHHFFLLLQKTFPPFVEIQTHNKSCNDALQSAQLKWIQASLNASKAAHLSLNIDRLQEGTISAGSIHGSLCN